MAIDIDQSLAEVEQLYKQIDQLQSDQNSVVEEIKRTIKRLQVPWTRIPNAPVEDCVMLSRRLIKLYSMIKDMPEKEALDAIQAQINFRTINMVAGRSDQPPTKK